MHISRLPHRWDISPKAAIAVQARLASRVKSSGLRAPVRRVAGADVAFSRDGLRAIAAVVVWDVASRSVVETRSATAELKFPYVPGLLTFREGPALVAAIRRLQCAPDAFLFDGQGLAHPRRFGLACHMGVLMDKPSAGCGKSRLVGEHDEPASRRGSRRPLRDREEEVGAVVRTRTGVKPVYVSVGHRMSLDDAVGLVLTCGAGYRLPEPTRLADQWVGRLKREGA